MPLPKGVAIPELEIERVLRETSDAQPPDAAAMAEPKARKRVDVIRDLAIELFNQEGVAGISTNRIASELGISPGNVHYHYRTKAAVLEATFEVLDRDLRDALAKPSAILGITEFVDWMIHFQRQLWRHRYFFGSLEVVIKTAPTLRVPWLKLQNELVLQLAAIHEYYVDKRIMIAPNAPNGIAQVAQNGLMLWISWIRWEFLNSDGRSLTRREENEIVHRLVEHHLSFYEPYHVRTRFVSEALVRALDERLFGAAGAALQEKIAAR